MSRNILSVWFAGVLIASISLSEARSNTGADSTVVKSLPVCLGKQLLSVPLVPQLQIVQPDGSLRDFRSLYRMDPERIQKVLDNAPLKARLIVLGSPSEDSSQPPLLDTLLGRNSPYKIRELRLYSGVWADFDTWMGTFPKSRTLQSGTELFVPKNAKIFGYPVKVSCNKGRFLESEDSKRRSCLLKGLKRSNSMISVIFNTASDLEGHWPTSVSDWETLDLSGWSNSLAELENAIQNTEVRETDKNICN